MNTTDYLDNLHEFVQHYVEAIYFTDTGDVDEPPGDTEFSVEALAKIVCDCAKFFSAAHALWISQEEDGHGVSMLAHDFWLTRNGHGAGFWDGDWPEAMGKELTDLADKFGECYVYLSDDNVLEI